MKMTGLWLPFICFYLHRIFPETTEPKWPSRVSHASVHVEGLDKTHRFFPYLLKNARAHSSRSRRLQLAVDCYFNVH